jgi:hypothetical protein
MFIYVYIRFYTSHALYSYNHRLIPPQVDLKSKQPCQRKKYVSTVNSLSMAAPTRNSVMTIAETTFTIK